MTNTEIIVNLATIIANQRLEISELKTEVEHLHHELLAMRVEADEPQTDCETCRYAGECDWKQWQKCYCEQQSVRSNLEPFRVDEPQTDEEQFCRDHKCTFYRPQEGGCTKNTGDCPFMEDPQIDCHWK